MSSRGESRASQGSARSVPASPAKSTSRRSRPSDLGVVDSALSSGDGSRRPSTAGERPEGGALGAGAAGPPPPAPPGGSCGGCGASQVASCRSTPAARPMSQCAERVKVFVRVRPTKAEGETPGSLRIKDDGAGVLIHRG